MTPVLVVVSGPPGAGKTRLAHQLARAIPCAAVCRDEIKEGMVHAAGGEFRPAAGDPLTVRTFDVFFDVVRVLLKAGVSVVVEAAFQDSLWRRGLEPLAGLAELRVVQCVVEPSVARARIERRRAEPGRAAHAKILDLDAFDEAYASFQRLSLAAPSIEVDTTDGFVPDVAAIAAFVDAPAPG